jgi:hypothetical protein
LNTRRVNQTNTHICYLLSHGLTPNQANEWFKLLQNRVYHT